MIKRAQSLEMTMKWDKIGNQPCSIARALAVVGDRWTMLILRNAFMGIRRFDDFHANLGVTRHLLSDRLKRLVEEGVLKKVPYEDRQQRFEYRLTEKGRDFYPILLGLIQWGDKWMDQGLGAPLDYIHQDCGKKFTPVMVCSECKEPVHARNVMPVIGQGLLAYNEKQTG